MLWACHRGEKFDRLGESFPRDCVPSAWHTIAFDAIDTDAFVDLGKIYNLKIEIEQIEKKRKQVLRVLARLFSDQKYFFFDGFASEKQSLPGKRDRGVTDYLFACMYRLTWLACHLIRRIRHGLPDIYLNFTVFLCVAKVWAAHVPHIATKTREIAFALFGTKDSASLIGAECWSIAFNEVSDNDILPFRECANPEFLVCRRSE